MSPYRFSSPISCFTEIQRSVTSWGHIASDRESWGSSFCLVLLCPRHPCCFAVSQNPTPSLAPCPSLACREKEPALGSCSALQPSTVLEKFSQASPIPAPHHVQLPLPRLPWSRSPDYFTRSPLTCFFLLWWKKWHSDFLTSEVWGCLVG